MKKVLFAKRFLAVLIGLAVLASAGIAAAAADFGQQQDSTMADKSKQLFGVLKPLAASSIDSISASAANGDPTRLVKLAEGLKARAIASHPNLAPNIDQMAFWPNDTSPTWIIACNEEGTGQPGVQRIRLSDGFTETILTGSSACDPIRRTPWGTIIFAEEVGNTGRLYEIFNPLMVTNTSLNRVTGAVTGGTNPQLVAARPAMGKNSYEGFAFYANGMVYYGDEQRPASGTAGGGLFKYVPTTPFSAGSIADLTQSPLTGGTIYGLRLGKNGAVPGTDYGQGTEYGLGTWVQICTAAACNDIDLRTQAANLKLTGTYRPEDIDLDRVAETAGKVRFCAANTGNEGANQLWGSVTCTTDGTIVGALAGTSVPETQLFVQGNPSLSMSDNLAFQPGRQNLLINEDADTNTTLQGPHNNDIWSCLPDGADVDQQSDGCVRVVTLRDLTAESTGGFFDPTGTHYYVSIQHNISGHGTILDITGWK